MANMKSLAKETAIYGLSSIVGRFLNYLLVPLYTAKLSVASGGYGVITNIYAYTALILVLLTFGMETTFFRFANHEGENVQRVYSTTLFAVGTVSMAFVGLVFVFLTPLSTLMGYADHPSYIWVMALTVAIDAFQCIPFAYLRYQKKAIKFAALKMLFILMNILFNIIYFLVLPACYAHAPELVGKIYDPTVGAGYAFYINLGCTAMITLFFYRELTGFRWTFDPQLMRRMFSYAWPILVLGIAGILNQTADKILFPYIYRGTDAHAQLAVYGAASKIAMIMAMITQAFRYAYEPFVFGKAKEKDSRDTYAKAMKYFIIFTLLAFLMVVGYLDILKYIIEQGYWSGLRVVPIVMAAEIMMGIYFNLSFWYKLIDKTIWGAWFSGIGCVVLITMNIVLVPSYGYMACAWAGFAGYGTAMLLSYLVGQKYYPIRYPMKEILQYVLLAVVSFVLMQLLKQACPIPVVLAGNTLIIAAFICWIVKNDFPLSSLPVIGKRFRNNK